MQDLLNYLLQIYESNIDFPREDLDLTIWDKEEGNYKIKPDIKQKILDILSEYPGDLVKIVTSEKGIIKFIGSLCTNLYADTSDVDTHITIPKTSKLFNNKEFQDKVEDWFRTNRDKIGAYIGEHPITVFIQFDPEHEMLLAEGCYDLLADKWLVPPKKAPMDYDPYENYSELFKVVEDSVEDADELFGELRRDIVDYEVIKQAMNRLSGEQRKTFLDKLNTKLKEIEVDIENLYKERKEWTDARKEASKDVDLEAAKKDIELAKKNWKDTNAIFKLVARYQYLRVIKELKDLLDEDGKIDQEDVKDVKGILGSQTEVGAASESKIMCFEQLYDELNRL